MTINVLRREQWIAQPLEHVFDLFSDASNLVKITPPWMGLEIVTPPPIKLAVGTRIAYRIRWRLFSLRWLTEIVEWDPPHRFVDMQLRGPYALWLHTHAFVRERDGTRIFDEVQYSLPYGVLGRATHRLSGCTGSERDFRLSSPAYWPSA